MITTVNCGLLLQLTRQPVNSSTCQQRTTNYANDTNYIIINISVIRKFVVHIIKFNVQTSKFQGKRVQSSNLNVQSIKIRSRCTNLFYISGQEKVRNGVENQLFCYLCKYFVIK